MASAQTTLENETHNYLLQQQQGVTKLDFETGDLSQWQCSQDLPPTNVLNIVQSPNPVKQGKYSLSASITGNKTVKEGGVRAELVYCDIVGSSKQLHYFSQGNDAWYHWYSLIPSTFHDPQLPITLPDGRKLNELWHTLTQWHGANDASPFGIPLGINLNNRLADGKIQNILNIRVKGAVYDNPNTPEGKICLNGSHPYYNKECGFLYTNMDNNQIFGNWHDILLHVKWSTGSDGLVEGKVDGKSIEKYIGSTLNPTDPSDAKVYLKQGLYRHPIITTAQTVYHDGMVVANCPNSVLDPSTNECSSTSSGSGTESPGQLSSAPSISTWGPDHLNAFILGSDGAIWNNPYFKNTSDPGPRWHSWVHTGNPGALGHPPGVSIISNPAAISIDNITIDVFATGSDKSLWYISNNRSLSGNGWLTWNHVGNTGESGHPQNVQITSAPDVVSWSSNHLDVFAKGSDNNTWYDSFDRTTSPKWSGWKIINSTSTTGTGVDPKSKIPLDFETRDLSQWTKDSTKRPTSQNNCAEYDYPNDNNHLDISKFNTYPNKSKYSLQVTLTKNAIIIPKTGSTGERAELKYCDSPNHVHYFSNGSDQWYHWYTMFSTNNFTLPGPEVQNPWHVWTQWHTGDGGTYTYGVPLEFDLDGNFISLRVLSHYYDSISCYSHIFKCGYLWSGTLSKGIWYEILIHTKWSNKENGIIEGHVTLHTGNTSSIQPILTYRGHNLNNLGNAPADDLKVFFKQGLYRNPPINVSQTLWHDGTTIAVCPTNTVYNPQPEKCISP